MAEEDGSSRSRGPVRSRTCIAPSPVELETFLRVAECRSLRKAAIGLAVGQPAVSRRIGYLEDHLGVSLFERHSSGVRLTATGWAFAEHAHFILQELYSVVEMARSAGAGCKGVLRLGLVASLSCGVMRDILAEFVAQHPRVDIRAVETERSKLLTLLNDRRLDAMMAAGGFSPDVGESLEISKEKIFVAVSEESDLARKGRLSWDSVQSVPFLVSSADPGPEIHDYIIRRLAGLGRRPNVTRHGLGREGIINLVGLGLGVSLVAEHWCGVTYPGVVFREIGEEDERIPFSLVWRADNDNPALRRFVSLARIEARKAAASLSAASQRPDPLP
ncbi:LysR family transcriptional regulator [Roseospira goensis]|uniref:LysR family transcriptional regulator n=1 Tax=Roseospira goensis TaxID=391922 RepID=UPI00160BD491